MSEWKWEGKWERKSKGGRESMMHVILRDECFLMYMQLYVFVSEWSTSCKEHLISYYCATMFWMKPELESCCIRLWFNPCTYNSPLRLYFVLGLEHSLPLLGDGDAVWEGPGRRSLIKKELTLAVGGLRTRRNTAFWLHGRHRNAIETTGH